MLRAGYLFRHLRLDFRQCRLYSQASRITSGQQVRLRKPWIRRFATTCLVYGAAFHLWSSLMYVQFDREIAHTSVDDSEVPKKGVIDRDSTADLEEEEEEASFIPLTWPRLSPGDLYSPTDAEWGNFAKIARDPQHLQSLRLELSNIVLAKVSRSPQTRRFFGGPLQLTENWLIPRFPYRAPPHYERIGLEISDTQIALVSRPIPPEDGDRIWKVLFPLTVASATFDALSVLWNRKMNRVDAILRADEHYTNGAIMSIKDLDFQSDLRNPKNISLPSFSEWENMSSNTAESSSSGEVKDVKSVRQYPSHLPAALSILQNIPLPDCKPGSDLHYALRAFKLRLFKAKLQHRAIPKRGVFYFSGPVGLRGPKGRFRVEVHGEYDPAEKKFTAVFIHLKDFNLFTQEPLGYRRHDQDD